MGRWIKIVVGSGLVILLIAGLFEIAGSYQRRLWGGKSRFTVVSLGQPTIIYSVDPAFKGVGVKLILPDDLMVDTVDGRGTWKVGVLRPLEKKYGKAWLIDSLENSLGLMITDKLPLTNFWDFLGYGLTTFGIDWEEVKVSETYLEEGTDPDGEKVLGLSMYWWKKVGELFFSANVASEGWQVSVFNSTNTTGLGYKMARVVETAGFKVIRVADTNQKTEKCVIKSNSADRNVWATQLLIKKWSCRWQENKELQEKEIELIVGESFSGWGKP
ncbi:hypothetical protein A2397_05675 [Candidatus Amesbacteria bacterium RIFOXYB1_FULL_44_23]|uniref:LytR/CpsA/Psr regulator C-terminal domain-containing protein n=1 Tax=Candidatus Amesbacteria bacterium RIFOXYB1_FULL_44_23 TaxID=1797263 RepID=A0A1F4ZP14_9BACT|nr:MAG: hypothetical protein A2397_05675 [Candidatus Amesbacteria bacterium RIFOXYB1_FULL_44_23]